MFTYNYAKHNYIHLGFRGFVGLFFVLVVLFVWFFFFNFLFYLKSLSAIRVIKKLKTIQGKSKYEDDRYHIVQVSEHGCMKKREINRIANFADYISL